ncbi:RnfABCDGE type electron transport complex subunit E [Clostridium sp.]|jgi:Na+-translocating ferredoxin:NAD+ oxidoreductase subunit E|uniref:RnfABCDGE type electron transport complex subunit E n=1 Tax=Clostridium sp. TaxID=1506 RepID=UPI0039F5ECB2
MGVLIERLKNGIFTENTIFVQVLAMCPTLAVTSSAINGIGMGLASTVVLMGANFVISLLRNVIPDKIRIPGFIVVIAGFVTLLQFLLQGFVPALNKSLGIFIPLIVVNCVILGRAEAYASKNKPVPAIFDGLGIGLGFTLSLAIIGMVRELLGTGKLFGFQIMPEAVDPALVFVLAPGAFITLGIMMALLNQRKISKKKVK